MKYVGKMCPYCKTRLLESESIVICSSCYMPHHKECWVENQGCTTFGCSGTIMCTGNDSIADDTASNRPVPKFCRKCGARRNANSNYCRLCGVRF